MPIFFSAGRVNVWAGAQIDNVMHLSFNISDTRHAKKILTKDITMYFKDSYRCQTRNILPSIYIFRSHYYRYNFSFPRSYPVNDNNWHVVAIVLKKTAELLFYLDGARRDPPKLTIGVPNSKHLYNFRTGTLYLGYYKVGRIYVMLPNHVQGSKCERFTKNLCLVQCFLSIL